MMQTFSNRAETGVAEGIRTLIGGYGATVLPEEGVCPDTTTEDYASDQSMTNVRKTLEYLLPIVERVGARRIVDVGCGVGTMVATLLEQGYDAYGTDLPGLERYWTQLHRPRDRFFLVGAQNTRLPFRTGSIDFTFTLGVIEHVGTADGHADRLPDYHAVRRRWLHELLRVVRCGGWALVGGPNRNFPVDVAHGPDSRASPLERGLSRLLGATVHKPWGENFLWSYGDLRRYLIGLPVVVEPLSVKGYVGFSRVPPLLRPLAEAYVNHLPKSLLGSGFNPWMMALLHKTGELPGGESK